MKKLLPRSPVRRMLRDGSSLTVSVKDGLGAVKHAHKDCFDEGVRGDFADSLDLDEALRVGRERENRWDYLLGHSPSAEVIAVEPHSAKPDQVSTVVKKRAAAREQLKGHLRDGARVSKWLWVASGKVQFADTEKTRRLLDQNGIEFAGTRVSARHLPEPAPAAGPARTRSRSKR